MRDADAVAWLRTPEAVRARCEELFEIGLRGELAHFTIDTTRLDAAARYVEETIRRNYPALDIPYHARWRHLATGAVDRWAAIAAALHDEPRDEVARIRFDLVALSVLLDAGAGAAWRYVEPATGQILARSEGLAVASLHAFRAGLFSSDPDHKLRADADGLEAVRETDLAEAFQSRPGNTLAGLPDRAALMRGLGAALRLRPDLFGTSRPRVGHLFDSLREQVGPDGLPARTILQSVLSGFAPMWPGRIILAGQNLGDVWRHRAVAPDGPAGGLVPFHKLSQWLSYSLIEVLEEAGVAVCGLDALTGLPEYRNGGLFLDLGVLRLRDPAIAARPLPVEHEAVVEWRALTVALLDRIAPKVRLRLGRTEAEMPLARVLEGGTWAAGRRIAAERRASGEPPLHLASDGTVF